MRTITIDIINEKALNLLRELELLELIRLHKGKSGEKSKAVDWKKYKGAMSKQSLEEIDYQLKELRNGWE